MFVESKVKTKLLRQMGEAVKDFGMIEDGDRVMVCLSGGKDSYTMLDLLLDVQKRAPVRFELLAVNLDQKQPNFPADVLPNYLAGRGVPFRIVERDTYSVVKRLVPEGKTFCSVCSDRKSTRLNSSHGYISYAVFCLKKKKKITKKITS